MVDSLSQIAIEKIRQEQFPNVEIWDCEFLNGERLLGICNW